MNNSKESKLSKKLSAVFDRMDEVNSSYDKIKSTIEAEYKVIQQKLNPENNPDITKELDYHFYDFLKNLLKKFNN